MSDQPDVRYSVETASGHTIEPSTTDYGEAVALARTHHFQTGEHARVAEFVRLGPGRTVHRRVRWRSWVEGKTRR